MQRACHAPCRTRATAAPALTEQDRVSCSGALRHLIGLVSLISSASLLAACAERPREPRDPTPGVPHFTIETFNVMSEGAGDPSTLAAVGAANADIVCMQETTAPWVAALEREYADRYPYRLYAPTPESSWLGIFSRFPVVDAGIEPGPNGWHPAWHLRVQTPAGWLQLLDVHLRSGTDGNGSGTNAYLTASQDHAYEMQLFESQNTPGVPTIVLGDFNEGEDGGAVRYLENHGFTDVLWLYHPGQWTWRHASIGDQFTQTLDHIMYDSSLEPLDAWVELAGNSDHIPVVAHFEAAHPW
jgi:endonuclease/exonuclease/phosphatase (EEP) superfamily protein YafD